MPLTSELTLASSPRAAADARRWVGDVCERLDRSDLVECAELGVSELVANAILHAAAPYKVRVRGTASHPRIEVVDGSPRPPVPPTPVEGDDLDLLLTFGRGLSMVAQCAVAWGATIESDGKIVWFEPAPEMTDAGSVEWVIDHHDRTPPEPTSEGAVDVRLLRIDVPLYTSLKRQYHELRRELRLLSLSHQSDYPLAGDLTSMFANFERQFPDTFRDQITEAEARGLPRVDVVVPDGPRGRPHLRDHDRDVRRRRRLLPGRATAVDGPHAAPARAAQLAARRAGPPARRCVRPAVGRQPGLGVVVHEPGRVTHRPIRAVDVLLVAAGGAVGAVLRHLVDVAAPDTLFPWPTLAINVVGAFVLGVLPVLAVVRRSPRVAATLGPGLLGGFTTVSAWAGQTRDLAAGGHVVVAGAYLALTLAAGLSAAALGQHLARRSEPEEALA